MMHLYRYFTFLMAFLGWPLIALAESIEVGHIGAARPWQMRFQDPVTPVQTLIVNFHNHLLLPVIIFICLFVLSLLAYVCWRFREKRNPVPSKISHNTTLEIVWTIIPLLILIVIAIPSFKLLFTMYQVPKADMTLKVTGFQWAWEYDYPDFGDVTFQSYLIPEKELKPGQLRLLSTDNPVVLPINKTIRIQTTARDVIHSWAMPSSGIKKDAVPGRLNETWARIEKEGVYFGQCSELCGTGHAYMPIEVWAVPQALFAEWVKLAKTNPTAARTYLIQNWPAAKGLPLALNNY